MSSKAPHMAPIVFGPNQPQRFYAGGAAICRLRGLPTSAPNTPEDWLASTTTIFGTDGTGLSRLPDGTLLRDAIAADPQAFLGPEHVAAFGTDPALLVKLLDAGERLPVHCHPDRRFAEAHLASAHGKTEAWVVLGCTADARVHLGFRHDVAADQLAGWVQDQDRPAMLEALHELPVAVGDTIVVPAGAPHSIGAGILVLELQEPTDFSVMLERESFGVDGDPDLGLGRDALGCVDRTAWDADRVASVRSRVVEGEWSGVLAPAADGFFRAEQVGAGLEMPPGYAVLLITAGSGTLATDHGGAVDVSGGTTVLVPYAAGASRLTGSAVAIRCRPPAVDAAAA